MCIDLLHLFPFIGHPSLQSSTIIHHHWVLPFELIDCLCMGPVLGQALADVPCIQSWCLTV